MPGKKATASALGVADILNRCQDATSGHGKYSRLLWELEAADSDACYKQLIRLLGSLLTVPLNTNANVERALKFFPTFTASAPHRENGSCAVFVQDLVADLALLSGAADKTVRVRACSLLAGVMQRMTVELEDQALDELQDTLLSRLKDKVPQVRQQAAIALERLAEPGDDGSFSGDPIVAGYRKLLAVERNSEVRKAILGVMPLAAQANIQDVIERTGDVSDAVRRQAHVVLANRCAPGDLSSDQRALLAGRGLRDRATGVRDAAAALVAAWLADDCGSDALRLLAALDVRRHPEEAQAALDALAALKLVKPREIAQSARDGASGLRAEPPGGVLLTAEEAFFWRWICETLWAESDRLGLESVAARGAEAEVVAAAGADSAQALEAALPASVAALRDIIAAHAAAGAERGFAVAQLLRIAAGCVDLGDASGRRAAAELLDAVLQHSAWIAGSSSSAWEQPFLRLAKQVYATTAELQAWLAGVALSYRERLAGGAADADYVQALSLAGLACTRQQSQMCRAALLDDVICPALARGQDVRAAAVKCLGLFALQATASFALGDAPALEQRLPVSLLRAALAEPAGSVRLEAAKALCDALLVRGPKALDACHTHMLAHPDELRSRAQGAAGFAAAVAAANEDSRPLLELLLPALDGLTSAKSNRRPSDDAAKDVAVGTAVAEGLAKLVMHQHHWPPDSENRLEDAQIVQVLERLLSAHIDPATEPAAAARQCLSVFFPAYAAFCGNHRAALAAAAMPAARHALGLPAKSAAPNLLRFVLQLLQAGGGDVTAAESDAFVRLAERCIGDVIRCPRTAPARPYVAALAKLAAGLPLQAAGAERVRALRVLTDTARSAVGAGQAAKDVAHLAKKLAALDVSPCEPLDDEAVAEILRAATDGSDGPPPFEAPPAAAARGTRRRAAQRAPIVESGSSSDSDSGDEEESSDEGDDTENTEQAEEQQDAQPPQTPRRAGGKQMPRRATRAALRENVMSPTL